MFVSVLVFRAINTIVSCRVTLLLSELMPMMIQIYRWGDGAKAQQAILPSSHPLPLLQLHAIVTTMIATIAGTAVDCTTATGHNSVPTSSSTDTGLTFNSYW